MTATGKTHGHGTRGGFTLLEMLIVVAILAILTAIAVPVIGAQLEKARQGVLKYNTQAMSDIVRVNALDFTRDKWYGSWSAYESGKGNDISTLNNFLEYQLETKQDGHYSNEINLINPYTKNSSILDYTGTFGSGDGYRPAAFLTATAQYAYDGKGNTKNIVGSIVVYFHVVNGTTDYIDLYYVNKDGSKSAFTRRIS